MLWEGPNSSSPAQPIYHPTTTFWNCTSWLYQRSPPYLHRPNSNIRVSYPFALGTPPFFCILSVPKLYCSINRPWKAPRMPMKVPRCQRKGVPIGYVLIAANPPTERLKLSKVVTRCSSCEDRNLHCQIFRRASMISCRYCAICDTSCTFIKEPQMPTRRDEPQESSALREPVYRPFSWDPITSQSSRQPERGTAPQSPRSSVVPELLRRDSEVSDNNTPLPPSGSEERGSMRTLGSDLTIGRSSPRPSSVFSQATTLYEPDSVAEGVEGVMTRLRRLGEHINEHWVDQEEVREADTPQTATLGEPGSAPDDIIRVNSALAQLRDRFREMDLYEDQVLQANALRGVTLDEPGSASDDIARLNSALAQWSERFRETDRYEAQVLQADTLRAATLGERGSASDEIETPGREENLTARLETTTQTSAAAPPPEEAHERPDSHGGVPEDNTPHESSEV